jgi:hypothetical protein
MKMKTNNKNTKTTKTKNTKTTKTNNTKTNNKLKGGYKWSCKKDKCKIKSYLTLSKTIINYKHLYDKIFLFLQTIDDKIYKYTSIEEINISNYKDYTTLNCNKCLYYYKNNPDVPLPNLLKLLLSLKLTLCTDYIYDKLNYIALFLPLLDNFVNTKSNYFRELYFTLKEKKNITFKNLDYLLVICINIINTLTKLTFVEGKITFITLINNILQIFKELKNNVTLTELLLKKLNIDILLINKLLNLFNININDNDINTFFNIDKFKEIIGDEIFEQLNLLLEDYNKVMKNVPLIEIQNYLQEKIKIFLEEYNFIDFGILPKLFNLNLEQNSYSGGSSGGSSGGGKYQKFENEEPNTQEPNTQPTKNSQKTNTKDTSSDKLKHVFNPDNSVTWSTFRQHLDPTTECIFDFINNNDYIVINHIFASISISSKFSDDKNIKKIIDNFNTYIYIPLYGKNCLNIYDLQNDNNNKSALISKKPTKSFISKIKGSIRLKGTIKIKDVLSIEKGIGLDDICIGLNKEYNVSEASLTTFDTFIGKILTLNLRLTQTFFHDMIKNKLLLFFLNYIMKNNVDTYFILQINLFHLNLEKNLNEIKTIFKTKNSYKSINSHISTLIDTTFKNLQDYELIKNYFLFYYEQFMKWLNEFIENYKGDIAKIPFVSYMIKFDSLLITEHKFTESILIQCFQYKMPMSSEFIELFLQIQIVNGNDGFNYVQYKGNKNYIENYSQTNNL